MNWNEICDKLKERLSANIVSHNNAKEGAIYDACKDDDGQLLDNTAYNILSVLGANISRRNKDVIIETIEGIGKEEFLKQLQRTKS